MSAAIIPETWHEPRLEKTKIESKINKINFHRFIIASTSERQAIAPQTDSMSSFFHRLRFEAKSFLAELLSSAEKSSKVSVSDPCNNRRIPSLHDLIFFCFFTRKLQQNAFSRNWLLVFRLEGTKQARSQGEGDDWVTNNPPSLNFWGFEIFVRNF